jgi:hypothetical protein
MPALAFEEVERVPFVEAFAKADAMGIIPKARIAAAIRLVVELFCFIDFDEMAM